MSDRTRLYPGWICHECGMKHGRTRPTRATWHHGICGVCNEFSAVTEPRDFGHLVGDDWIDEVKKNFPAL